MKRLFSALSILFLFTISSFAQDQIISTDEANELFGEPANTVRIYSTVVESLLDTHEFIMIRIDGDQVNVLGKDRAPVIQQFDVEDQDVYYVFESKILKELLQIGTENQSYIELRIGGNAASKYSNSITDDGEIITISNGNVAQIPQFFCPPFCF